jgi:hypothetical protein
VSKEIQVVSAVRPLVDVMTKALESGDKAAAVAAYEAYDAAWNGVEVYVLFRSKDTYDMLEAKLQHEIDLGLTAAQPDLKAVAKVSAQLASEWDKAIAMLKAGKAISPLFDDVATIRMIRSDLRIVTAAIAAGNPAKARTYWTSFFSKVAPAKDLIAQRIGLTDLNAALAAADAKFKDTAATADQLKPLVAAVTTTYNFGLSLTNAAARNADLSKKAWTDDDVASLASLNDVAIQLANSTKAWQAGDFASATTAAASASKAFAAVQAKLAAHEGADVALKTALDAQAKLAGAAGDAAKVVAANKTAQDAILVAQHVFVGQFWTDQALQAKIKAFPKS